MAHLVDLTPADLAAGVELRHALDVPNSPAGLASLLGDVRIFLDCGDVEAAVIAVGHAQRMARLIGGEVA